MIRLLPPRGRTLVVTVACLALLPAAALAADLSAPDRVSGRAALTLTVPPTDGAWTVTLRAADDRTGVWHATEGGELTLDLDAPDEGDAPVNGPAELTVEGPGDLALTATVTVDLDPPSPALAAVARGQRVDLHWDRVNAPGRVTYRVERATSGSDWTVLAESTRAAGYTDRGLDPGRYRYRLTALVAAADGGVNASQPAAEQVRVAAPSPSPQAQAPTVPKPTPPELPDPPADDAPAERKPRDVAATGDVRGPVRADGAPDRTQGAGAPGPTMTANGPSLSTSSAPLDEQTTVTPPTAAPRPGRELGSSSVPEPDVAGPQSSGPPLPVVVPPMGSLAVEAAAADTQDAVAVLVGLAFLGLALTFGRRRLNLSGVTWGARRSRSTQPGGRSRLRGRRSVRSSGTPEPS